MSALKPRNEAQAKQLEALHRLWKIANGNSGQCRHVALFLLSLYNGSRFPFDLTRLRCLDTAIFHDCLQVLVLDNRPMYEVHIWLDVSSGDFEDLAVTWGFQDMTDAWRKVHG